VAGHDPVFFAADSPFDLMSSRDSAGVRSFVATPRPLTGAAGLVAEIDRLRTVCAELEAERRRLTVALADCADENVALRASALLWIALYERHLVRANALAEAVRVCSGGSIDRCSNPHPGLPHQGDGLQGRPVASVVERLP
jgi:hypothetical protein